MKRFAFLFFLFIFFSFKVEGDVKQPDKNFTGCNYDINEENIKAINNLKIKKINIDIHNYRNWTVSNIRIITSNTRFIPNNLKKRFDATIKVIYENDIECVLKGRVRHSGDAKDHIALKDNSIIQSLDVTLEYGNIRGVTRFKLFKPDVRGVLEDVVIQSKILRDLGFLAPRSISVIAKVNETESVMLFQEKAAKELLEYNNRREGPILEGDQKFFFELVKNIPDNNISNWSVGTPALRSKSSKVMLSKLTNANLTSKGNIHKEISLDAINKLNLIYLYWSNRFQDEKNNFYFFDYDLDNSLLSMFEKDKIIKLEMYNLFMQSTNSHHALSASNRKFYWNSIENFFEPIMYDSNPNIETNFSDTTTAKIRYPISSLYLESIERLEKRLTKIDVEKLHTYSNYNGLDLTNTDIRRKIVKIRNNLNLIKENYIKNLNEEVNSHNTYKYKEDIFSNFNKYLQEISPKTLLIKLEDDKFFKCGVNLDNCKIYNISEKELLMLLEGELIKNDINYQFVGQNIDLNYLYREDNYNKEKYLDTTIFYEKGSKLNIDYDKNIISIYQNKVGAKTYIKDGSLQGTKIIFNGVGISMDTIPPNYPIDTKGLTGCLSLINLNLKNVDISFTNSNCEDSVNFINSNGNVKKISIKNSYSDALDVDFSELIFDKIDVSNAKNDCIDFSYGNYNLGNLVLDDCGDKAVSVGEGSELSIKNLKASNSNMGVASKDSSIVNLHNVSVENVSICLAAYKKKQEFNGGIININDNFNCNNFEIKQSVDKFSLINN